MFFFFFFFSFISYVISPNIFVNDDLRHPLYVRVVKCCTLKIYSMDQDQCELHGAGQVNGSVFLLVLTTNKDTVLCECGRGCQLVPSARQNRNVAEHLDRFNHKPCSAVVSGMFQLTQLSSHCGCLFLTYPLVHTNIGRE